MRTLMLIFAFVAGLSGTAKAEHYRFLFDDTDALQTRVDLIQQAKQEILLEYFQITNDEVSTGLLALLCEASKRGVSVKLLIDGIFNGIKDPTMAAAAFGCKDKLGKNNIEFKVFNPITLEHLPDLLSRDHDKMFIVDGNAMIVGGRNIDGSYFGVGKKRMFKDLDILITGKVVKEARAYFYALWNNNDGVKKVYLDKFDREKLLQRCTGLYFDSHCRFYSEKYYDISKKDYESAALRFDVLIAYMKNRILPKMAYNTGNNIFKDMREINGVKLLSTSPYQKVGLNNMKIAEDLFTLIGKAKKKVLILSPYLVPTKKAFELFQSLIDRKVQVTIVTNSLKSTDGLLPQAGYRASKNVLTKMGIELYEYDRLVTAHAKTAVIDDETVFIGSYNLDPRSAEINREIGLAITDTKGSGIVEELNEIIEEFRSESLLVAKKGKRMNEKLQDAEVSSAKLRTVQILEQTVPLIKDQL